MVISDKKVWVIMSKCRQFIAKGTPRNREIVRVDDEKDNKRYLTYTTKGKAECGFKTHGFYGIGAMGAKYGSDLEDYLDAVEVKMTIETIEES